MTDKITKALETVNELHGETLKKLDDDLPLVGYLITVSAILRSEGREEWAEKIGIAASKINEMQNHIRILQEIVREDMKELVQYRAENEKLRAALVKTLDYIDDPYDEFYIELGQLLESLEAAALKETGDE